MRLGGFVVRALGWLPIAFFGWYVAAPILLWPAALLVKGISWAGLSDLVVAIEQSGATLTFVTSLRPGTGAAQAARVTVDVNMLVYAFGLPLYAALVLAARGANWPLLLAAGYAALTPVVAWGTLADFLKNIAITAGPLIASQTGFAGWQREVIAFAYQLGALILPTVAPAVLWVLTHDAFLERMRRGAA
ncbi:MAG TPA: exosortase H-associated membrane protein [Casimicrobiaceae bacterium]|nr:exosortase H-associated membrane protein [Casimicrobiaceae bacterium]